LLALSFFFVTPTTASSAVPPELKKIHILVALDTDSNLVDGLRIDEKQLEDTFLATIPLQRHTYDVLTGKDVTREKILERFRKLKVAPDEGIVFFYGGHGATHPDKGHFLQLKNGPPLLRSELRKAMEAKKAGLVVVLTDCCSTPYVKLPPKSGVTGKTGSVGAKTLHPTMSSLFFRARGVVDITAATDNAAWGDLQDGGLFTRTFCRLSQLSIRSLDRNGDGLVTWQEFFPKLQNETQLTFATWSRQMRARGESIEASIQRPRSFALGEAMASAVAQPPVGNVKSFAVISLENKTEKHLGFRYRWHNEAETAWKRGELRANGQLVVFTEVDGPIGDAFELLIEFDGRKGTGHLTPREWRGRGKPTFADGELVVIGSSK